MLAIRSGGAKSCSQGRKALVRIGDGNRKPRKGDISSGKRMPSTYTNLLYHIVFSTKDRIPLIADNIQREHYKYIGGIIGAEGGVQLEIGGMREHVHILAKFKAAISVAEMLNKIKSNSSKWANDHKMKLHKFGWQEGYAAFSVSESQVPAVREYIRNQEEHHRKQTYQEEFVALLERHGIASDPRYLWD
jgi:REP element-mobilizing transposase RayT